MIVSNTGYLKLVDVQDMFKSEHQFSIYRTPRKTDILVRDHDQLQTCLYYAKKDRLPWKVVEGKKIREGKRVFSSKVDRIEDLDTTQWNNGNQIMSYRHFDYEKDC